jgi:tetratricopeptide (TPR) repeat protein
VPELPDHIFEEVTRLSELGNALAAEGDLDGAALRFREAWMALSEPRLAWQAALWVLGAIGDVEFQRGRFLEAREQLMEAMKHFDGAAGNPFLRLRLGQALYEPGEEREASSWLAGAFLMEGLKLFEDEDPKYFAFVKPQLQPPVGGWPYGW